MKKLLHMALPIWNPWTEAGNGIGEPTIYMEICMRRRSCIKTIIQSSAIALCLSTIPMGVLLNRCKERLDVILDAPFFIIIQYKY